MSESPEEFNDRVAAWQLQLEAVALLRSIKSMVKFFVFITVLSIIGTIIALIVAGTQASNNNGFNGVPAPIVQTH